MKMFGRFGLTSLAMVVMKAGGRAVAMRERACRAERAESAGGLRGKPMVILWTEREWQRFYSNAKKFCFFKIQNRQINISLFLDVIFRSIICCLCACLNCQTHIFTPPPPHDVLLLDGFKMWFAAHFFSNIIYNLWFAVEEIKSIKLKLVK